jgi:diaminopimelate epimerase
VTASALVAHVRLGMGSPVAVRVQGGDTLEVTFRREDDRFSEVCLVGPADFVFEGVVEI